MSTTVIVLIVLGVVFIFASYAFSEKLSDNSIKENNGVDISILDDEQKEKLNGIISDYMDQTVDSKLDDVEAKFAEIINQKTLALGDYAVTVNEEIERNHNEVMFLYSMLSDKQKELMTTATALDEYRKNIEDFIRQNIDIKTSDESSELESAIKEIDHNIVSNEQETVQPQVQLQEPEPVEEPDVEPIDSGRDIILELHKSGLSILEIAKQLGMGVGEVKLVVDLYQKQGDR